VCDDNTNTCTGTGEGDTCSDHKECDSDLSCRVMSIWPYGTTCQPRGEVNSLCESDYDCKTRNFCWKLSSTSDQICLEKHNSPYNTTFFWDSVKFPSVTKEAVLFHGQYCQSGYAWRKSANVAECIDVAYITQSSNPTSKLSSPYGCNPDGKNAC